MKKKNLGLVFLLGIFLIGCKTKQRTVYRGNKSKTVKSIPKKNTVNNKANDGGVYPMPTDTGEFVRLNINSIQEYINTFAEVAQLEMKAYHIPASITLAQGLLESGFGKGALAMKTNNHFGIKCHTGWEGDYDFYDDDEKGECFRKYNHPMYSYRDHSLFLKTRSRYAFLFQLKHDDYKKWAKGLKQAGYATDKRYPQKLISLIEQHQLYKYDTAVSNNGYNSRKESNNNSTDARNNVKVHIVKPGETLYSISKQYTVSVADLKRWNYMYSNTLSIGQKLTVGTKKFN